MATKCSTAKGNKLSIRSLIESPIAPHLKNPTADEQDALDGYWLAVAKHTDDIAEIRKSFPGWMPEWNYRKMAI